MHTREEEPQDPTKKYDTRDLPIGGVIKGVIAFFVFTILMGPASCLALKSVGGNVGTPYLGHEPNPVADESSFTARRIPQAPNPILQNNVTAKSDLHDMRREENMLLQNGGLNKTLKTQTIPLTQAIDEEASKAGK